MTTEKINKHVCLNQGRHTLGLENHSHVNTYYQARPVITIAPSLVTQHWPPENNSIESPPLYIISCAPTEMQDGIGVGGTYHLGAGDTPCGALSLTSTGWWYGMCPFCLGFCFLFVGSSARGRTQDLFRSLRERSCATERKYPVLAPVVALFEPN